MANNHIRSIHSHWIPRCLCVVNKAEAASCSLYIYIYFIVKRMAIYTVYIVLRADHRTLYFSLWPNINSVSYFYFFFTFSDDRYVIYQLDAVTNRCHSTRKKIKKKGENARVFLHMESLKPKYILFHMAPSSFSIIYSYFLTYFAPFQSHLYI